MSGKTSETREKQKQDAQTFENESIFWAPKVAKELQVPVGHNIRKFRFISENIEHVGTPKIGGRVDSDTVSICLRQRWEFCIKMRVVPESQTFLLILETAKVPKNLLKT
jgi:hypothetical protein